MKTSGNAVLITGGATGIGLALAGALLDAGNRVAVCGRRQSRLDEARSRFPQLQAVQCDIATPAGREALYRWAEAEFPGINMLVNNAGISRSIDFRQGAAALLAGEDEIVVDFLAPVHLSAWFVPLLMRQPEAAVVNITSGLAFVPIASTPLYCAAKAGLHLFTVSLRHQLKDTPVRVFEIMPPIVDTDLGKDTTDAAVRVHRGVPPAEFAARFMAALENDDYESASGEAQHLMEGARKDFSGTFNVLNDR